MAKKVYKHNDYYGYINKIQEKAISNPDWFWSDAEDASRARQWLHDNNAGAIVDEIYDNTPDDIKKKISYKKLTSDKAQEIYDKGIIDATNKAAKQIGEVAATGAILVPAITTAPIATVGGIVGGTMGSIGSNVLSQQLTGQSLDYHVGQALSLPSRIFKKGNVAYAPWNGYVVGKTKNGKNVYYAPRQEKLESIGAWANPVTFVTGLASAKVAPAMAKNAAQNAFIRKSLKNGKLTLSEKPTTFEGIHQSEKPIYKPNLPFKERWDVVEHGADPNGMFFTVGDPAEAGFLSKRPFLSNWKIKSKKVLTQHGELEMPDLWLSELNSGKNSLRNKVVKVGRKKGADSILFEDIADNQLQHQNILFATDKADFKLGSHNYYNKFKKVDTSSLNDDIAKGKISDVIATAYAKNKKFIPEEFRQFVQNAVDKNGNYNKNDVKQVFEEVYKMMDAQGIPYTSAEQITGQRVFRKGKVKRNGNLYDHSFGAANSALRAGNHAKVDINQQVQADLYHDIGKIIDKNTNTHAKYSVDIANFLFDNKNGNKTLKNAIRDHMNDDLVDKTFSSRRLLKSIMRDDRFTGANTEEGAKFVNEKWFNWGKELRPLDTSDASLSSAAERNTSRLQKASEAFKYARGITQSEMLARALQSGEINGVRMIDDAISKLGPEEISKIQIENPFTWSGVKDIYKELDGSAWRKALKIARGYKALKKSSLPITKSGYHGNIIDFINEADADKRGLTSFFRYETETNAPKNTLFGVGDRSGSAYIYGLTANAPKQIIPNSYSGKVGTKINLVANASAKQAAAKRIGAFIDAFNTIINGNGTAEDLKVMLHNFSSVENPTLMSELFRGKDHVDIGKLPLNNVLPLERRSWITKNINDLSDLAKSKINYSLEVPEKISLTNPRNIETFRSTPYTGNNLFNGTITEVQRGYVKEKDLVDLPEMFNFTLDKYKDSDAIKALLFKLKPEKDKYPNLWKYLSNSKTIKTDGIMASLEKDNPRKSIRFKVGDFRGIRYNGDNPQEIITLSKNTKK